MDRRSWTQQEDHAIRLLVQEFGLLDWTNISEKLKQRYNIKQRTGKQCRQRWYNHLNPEVNKKPWTNEQQNQLFEIHRKSGNKWKLMSNYFDGRTDNDIKNHFYSTLRRSLRRLNKFIGQKNSTTQMRQIKPSVLSTIMNYIYEQENNIQANIVNSLKDLPYLIFEFSNYKPVKTKIKDEEDQKIKQKINFIFSLINSANSTYQALKQVSRAIKSKKHTQTASISDDCKKEDSQQIDFIKYLPKKTYNPNSLSSPKKSKDKSHKFYYKKEDDSGMKLEENPKYGQQKQQIHNPPEMIQDDLQNHSEFLVKREYQNEYCSSNQKNCAYMQHFQELNCLRSRRISLEAHEDFMQDESIGDLQQPSNGSEFYCERGNFDELVIVGKQIIPIQQEDYKRNQQKMNQNQVQQNQNIDQLIQMNYSH